MQASLVASQATSPAVGFSMLPAFVGHRALT